MKTVDEPPNFRYIYHEKSCSTCEKCQAAALIGMFCTKYSNYPTTRDYVCDDWENVLSEKTKYVTGPAI